MRYSHDRPLSNLAGKKFLLGVGAQKCGTSWLHKYLNSHPEIRLSAIKELHYFDQILRPELSAKWPQKFERKLDAMLVSAVGRTFSKSDLARLRCLIARVKMNYDPGMYLDYFNRLAEEGSPVIGEITPSYSLLRAEAFKRVRATLLRYGLQPRVLFLMRDPAQRFWSHVRFDVGRRRHRQADDIDNVFQAALVDANYLERTRYDLTIVSLKAAFAADELYFGFYESLFTHAGIRVICKFLGVSEDHGAVFDPINVSPPASLGIEKLMLLRETFTEVYRFCEAEFGEQLPQAWRVQQG